MQNTDIDNVIAEALSLKNEAPKNVRVASKLHVGEAEIAGRPVRVGFVRSVARFLARIFTWGKKETMPIVEVKAVNIITAQSQVPIENQTKYDLRMLAEEQFRNMDTSQMTMN